MQSQNPLLDDLARVASGALGVAAGLRGEAEGGSQLVAASAVPATSGDRPKPGIRTT